MFQAFNVENLRKNFTKEVNMINKSLTLEQIREVLDSFWSDSFCNSTACTNENKCIDCLKAEFERIANDK